MKEKKWSRYYLFSGLGVLIAFALFLIFKAGGADRPEDAYPYSAVQLLEKQSDTEESSYRVSATLPKTDFSSVSRMLLDEIAKEWNTFDSMTREQKLLSSRLWGAVSLQTDTWRECEAVIGATVYNPLETMDWLHKTGYFGMESKNPSMPVKHVQILANAAQNADRKLSEITVTAGYHTGDVRVTLTVTLLADGGTYSIGNVSEGYATYEEKTAATKTGIPVLIVATDETNNKETTAYWVNDNVFYSLRVFGNETEKVEIQGILGRILAEIE